MKDGDEGDLEEIPAGGHHQSSQQQPEQLLLLVEAIAEIVRQNSYQLRQTMQAVERLARVVEEARQNQAGNGPD